MIITYPRVCFRWHNPNKGVCGVLEPIKDFMEGYGYNLEKGQHIYRISYNGDIGYHCTIGDVTEEGILLDKWMEQDFKTDRFKKLGLVREDGKALLPWIVNGVEIEIEPCEPLYENYKVADLMRERCHFYQHGGWRQSVGVSRHSLNLKNIVVTGQYELELKE